MVVVSETKESQLLALLEQCVHLDADVRPRTEKAFYGDGSAAVERSGAQGGSSSAGSNQGMVKAISECGVLLL